eukprot:Em0002g489a
MEVIKGGSLGQGTAVNGKFDLDLVIITRGERLNQESKNVEECDLLRYASCKAKVLLDGVACDAAHRQAGSEEASAVTKELKKLVEKNQFIDVHWDEYYSIGHTGTGITLPPHCAAAPRILDPANPFYNVYHEGFSYSQNPCSEWEKVAGNIDTLDLDKQDGMRIGPNRFH